MKKLLFILVLMVIVQITNAQSLNWGWSDTVYTTWTRVAPAHAWSKPYILEVTLQDTGGTVLVGFRTGNILDTSFTEGTSYRTNPIRWGSNQLVIWSCYADTIFLRTLTDTTFIQLNTYEGGIIPSIRGR